MNILNKIVSGAVVRINSILAWVAVALIGSGTALYSGRAALIVVGSVILFDSFIDRIRGK